ncbi:hypothetical protein ACX6XY_18580 [Streptomyces sp. O3]
MPRTTPALTSQLIGRTHYATVPLRERLLASAGITFPQSVALEFLRAAGDDAVAHADAVDRLTGTLKTDGATARETLAALTAAGLAEQPPGTGSRLRVTERGPPGCRPRSRPCPRLRWVCRPVCKAGRRGPAVPCRG